MPGGSRGGWTVRPIGALLQAPNANQLNCNRRQPRVGRENIPRVRHASDRAHSSRDIVAQSTHPQMIRSAVSEPRGFVRTTLSASTRCSMKPRISEFPPQSNGVGRWSNRWPWRLQAASLAQSWSGIKPASESNECEIKAVQSQGEARRPNAVEPCH